MAGFARRRTVTPFMQTAGMIAAKIGLSTFLGRRTSKLSFSGVPDCPFVGVRVLASDDRSAAAGGGFRGSGAVSTVSFVSLGSGTASDEREQGTYSTLEKVHT
jgi:hypothetical protein